MAHIFPGLNYFPKTNDKTGKHTFLEQFYYDEFIERYLSLVNEHKDKIISMFGAHIHRKGVKAPLSNTHPDLDLKIIITPSVCPVYKNNPAYTLAKFGKSENNKIMIKEITSHNF